MTTAFRDAQLQAAADMMAHLSTDDVTLENAAVVPGILDYPTDPTTLGGSGHGGISMPMRDPELTLLEKDGTTVVRGSKVVLRGLTFDVVDRFPTGNGFVRFPLVEQQASDPAGTTWR